MQTLLLCREYAPDSQFWSEARPIHVAPYLKKSACCHFFVKSNSKKRESFSNTILGDHIRILECKRCCCVQNIPLTPKFGVKQDLYTLQLTCKNHLAAAEHGHADGVDALHG